MGFTAQSGFLGVRTQVTKGTYLNPGAANPNNGIYMRFRTGSLGARRELLIPDAEIGGNRDITTAELGPVAYEGTYSFYPRMDSLPTWLKGALGVAVDTSNNSGVSGLVATPSASGGTLAAGAKAYRVSEVFPEGESAGCVEVTATTTGATGSVVLTWTSDPRAISYKVYGRTTGAELFIATVTAPTVTYTDTGSVTPAGALPAGITTPSLVVGTHVINTADQLPWLSIEEQIANAYEVFNYTDVKVNNLSFSVVAKGFFEGSLDLVGITQTAGNTPTALANRVTDTSPAQVGTAILVTYNGITLPAKELKFDVKNNLEVDDERLGQFTVGDVTEKRRDITMTVKVRPADSTLWRQAVYGSPSAVSPQGSPVVSPVVITVPTWENIGTTTVPYKLAITVPSGSIKPFKLAPSHDSVLENDFEIQAFRPNPAVDIITATVTNGQTKTF
jgi:hypothetical protein